MKKSLSFPSVKTRQKSAPFQVGAKSEPLSGSLQTGLRFLRPPLPAALSAYLVVRFPKQMYICRENIGLTQLMVKEKRNREGGVLIPEGAVVSLLARFSNSPPLVPFGHSV
jgi:hypothetical protein